jgi:hypothetical protein
MSYMQLIGVGVVSMWRRRKNKNHENVFEVPIMGTLILLQVTLSN